MPANATSSLSQLPPLIVHEDEDLLLVNKPAGWNTHAPSPYANEGIYEWLRHRDPRWASLAIMHRLDKETSGLLLFTKTPAANRSLTHQFSEHLVRKAYQLLTDRRGPQGPVTATFPIFRNGDHYVSDPRGQNAETSFHPEDNPSGKVGTGNAVQRHIRAEPTTGRTHQIRVHAATLGFPILGDVLYGGSPASRLFLHAARLRFTHPTTQEVLDFQCPAPWENQGPTDSSLAFRSRTTSIPMEETNAFRLVHGASDGWEGAYVEQLGSCLLAQTSEPLRKDQIAMLESWSATAGFPGGGIYHKLLLRRVRGIAPQQVSPERVSGAVASERFVIRENGLQFELSFQEGYSIGLFLDQRDNRRRWKCGHVAAGFDLKVPGFESRELLNTFSYTCGFSVAAAAGGWRTTSLDLSKKYLEWGRRNFTLNGIDLVGQDFVYGDTLDWLRRWAKKGRKFQGIVLDPPTFSESKEHGRFQAERDYGKLVQAAVGVLSPGGVLLASTNAAKLDPETFIAEVQAGVRAAGKKVGQTHYAPQPPDFPISREEPGYLKTYWVRAL